MSVGYDDTLEDDQKNSDPAEPWPLTRAEMNAFSRGIEKGIIVPEIIPHEDGHTYLGFRVPDTAKKEAVTTVRNTMLYSRHERNRLAAANTVIAMVRADVAAEAKRTDNAVIVPVALQPGVAAAVLQLMNNQLG